MPNAFSHLSAPNYPSQPGEFRPSAEAAVQPAIPVAPVETPQAFIAPAMPELEIERRTATDLAVPADAYRGDQYHIPQSPEVTRHQASAEAGRTGAESVFPDAHHQLGAAETQPGFAPEDLSPGIETMQYPQGGEVSEAYNAACAVVAVRRIFAPESRN